jgi:peroxiredoxin
MPLSTRFLKKCPPVHLFKETLIIQSFGRILQLSSCSIIDLYAIIIIKAFIMKHLTKNKAAVPFTGIDIFDNTIQLKNYQGKKILLVFFRVATCPFCNMAVQELIRNHSEFEKKDIQIIGLFSSSKEDILKYAGKQKPPFPIIADPNFEIYKAYGVEISYGGMMKSMLNPKKVFKAMFGGFFNMKSMKDKPIIPADFLIDEHQIIHRAYYGKDFGDHIPVAEVLEWKE